MYKTHKNNIAQIRDAVEQFGTIWFHGDGNIFDKEQDSNFRQEFSNPDADDSKARMKFSQGDYIPDTLEELNRLLTQNTQREKAIKKQQEKTGNPIKLLRSTREANAPGADDLKQKEAELDQRAKDLEDVQTKTAAQIKDAQDQIEGKAKELVDRQAQLDQREKELAEREKKLNMTAKKGAAAVTNDAQQS